MKTTVTDLVPGLLGAVIGGILGYYVYEWGLGQSLKAGVIPGAFVGLGSGVLSSRKSMIRGILCGIGALALGLYVEWRNFDVSLSYFLTHVHKLPSLVLLMVALGTFLGFRWGGDGFKPWSGKPTITPRMD